MTSVPFRGLPGISDFFADYVAEEPRISRFYPNPFNLNSLVDFARRRRSVPLPHRDKLAAALAEQQRSWDGNLETVERLAGGAVAVLTGQQPGLFTGPLYSIFKAISAIKLARLITDSGISAVPVFWAAAEDHDYEEIQWAAILDRDSRLQRFEVDLANNEALPSGWMRFKEDVAGVVSECLSSLPASEFQPELRGILEDSYRPGRSPVDSFARMMTRLFRHMGLIVVDPLDPRLKEIAAPTLHEVVRKNERIRQAVLERSRAISAAGYHEQVKVDQNFTGLFALRGNSRQALKPDQLTADVALSPNVLVRPAIQDTIFPTAVLVAGPAEIAYLAQASAVYEELGKELPPIFPRISATLLEARVTKSLQKYNLQLADVFQGKDSIKRRAVENVQGTVAFSRFKEQLNSMVESLRPSLNAVDPTLTGALDNAKQKMVYQVESLETKFINAEARRNDLMEKHLELIANSLFPDKKLQERQLSVVSYIARYGPDLINRLESTASLDTTAHQLIEI